MNLMQCNMSEVGLSWVKLSIFWFDFHFEGYIKVLKNKYTFIT